MTRRPRLLVIDPSVSYPEKTGVDEIVRHWPGETVLLEPALRPGDGPAPGYGYDVDGVVVMGSLASVHDDLPWLHALGEWLDPLLVEGASADAASRGGGAPGGRGRIPVLGLCFGHQLIAHLRGGEVGFVRPDRSKVVGIRETTFEGSRLLPGRHTMRVVVSHCEEVKKAPPGYRTVASRPGCAIDGMEHERLPVFGYQFHAEAGEDFLPVRGFDTPAYDRAMREGADRLLAAFRRLANGSATD